MGWLKSRDFKQKIINQTDKIVNDAELTGSVNTILLDKDKIIGENTDVYGLQAAYLKEIDNCAKKNALVIGAGGVSPSVILSLQKTGIANISITNRTNEKCIFCEKCFSQKMHSSLDSSVLSSLSGVNQLLRASLSSS